MSHVFKRLLYLIFLILSPLALIVPLGAIYVAIQMINGIELLAGIHSFIVLLYGLMPYLTYLTTIPVVILFIIILLKNQHKIRERMKKN